MSVYTGRLLRTALAHSVGVQAKSSSATQLSSGRQFTFSNTKFLSSPLMQKSAEGRDFGGEYKSGRDHVEMTADERELESAACEARTSSCDQTTIFRFGNKIICNTGAP